MFDGFRPDNVLIHMHQVVTFLSLPDQALRLPAFDRERGVWNRGDVLRVQTISKI